MKEHRLHPVWRNMKGRCYNPKHCKYPIYGGRGITVCDEWRNSFQAFLDWAIANGYQEGLSIDRIDVNGNYEPSNCRFATREEQARNKRNNRYLTYNGETRTIPDWADVVQIPYMVLYSRIQYHGWSAERALHTPYCEDRAHKRKVQHGA